MPDSARKYPKLKKKSWIWRWAVALIIGFVVLVSVAVIWPQVDPEGYANLQAEADQARADRAAKREKADLAESERRSANLAEEHDEIDAYLTPCDNAWDKLGSFMRGGSGTPLEGYQLAAAAERICDASWSKLREVEKRDDRAVTDETIEVCQISANNRTRASKAIGAVFDGDTRPSAMTNATELVRGAEGAIVECKNTLAAPATEGAS